jgi:hypothetical protein
MHRAVLAFEVFHGTTTGVELGKDFVRVFNEYGFDREFIVAVVTDTTGNMNTFGQSLRDVGVTHLYCVDHVLHLNAKHAYNDDNLPNSDNAMRAARSLVEYFTKSTQAMDKLLQQQRVNPMYAGRNPLKVLQDVMTRWWSTYRMLARLRYLRKAIQVLSVNGEISARDLSEEQKHILDEVELLLKPTAKAQCLLEGDKYPMISLVSYFLHQIWLQYERMADDAELDLSESVRSLAQKLLDDFEKRYLKQSEPVFSSQIHRERGRYVGIQRETVLASALDPCTKHLHPFIPEGEHDAIWKEVLAMMIAVKETAILGVAATQVNGSGQEGPTAMIGVTTGVDHDSG